VNIVSQEILKDFWSKDALQMNFLPLIAVFLCILFLFMFTRAGFELSAFGLIFSIMLIIEWRLAFKKIYIAVLTPALLILIFYFGLKLRLPLLISGLLK
jgi:hypothetical protein